MTVLLFVAGLVTLVAGGELLVRGAARLAAATGISPLVIGLTVVAFGTSSPELAVSVQAALAGQSGIAVGNVVGSNIFNVLLILGLSAIVVPLVVSAQLVRIDVPIMIGISVVSWIMALDGTISHVEAALLLASLVAYIAVQIVISRRAGLLQDDSVDTGSKPMNVLFIVVGLALLVLGARWLVEAAVAMAQAFGVSELVVGLTIVAAGTSMPELATSVIAGIRGQRDIAVGNVIGSNIFNLAAVVGTSGLVASAGIPVAPAAVQIDLPIMVAVAILCLPIFLSKYTISRWDGTLFVAYYVLYTLYLILDATDHEILPGYRTTVLLIVLPLTLLTVLGFSMRAWWQRRNAEP